MGGSTFFQGGDHGLFAEDEAKVLLVLRVKSPSLDLTLGLKWTAVVPVWVGGLSELM